VRMVMMLLAVTGRLVARDVLHVTAISVVSAIVAEFRTSDLVRGQFFPEYCLVLFD